MTEQRKREARIRSACKWFVPPPDKPRPYASLHVGLVKRGRAAIASGIHAL